jgi:two-component system LytT family response regulator
MKKFISPRKGKEQSLNGSNSGCQISVLYMGHSLYLTKEMITCLEGDGNYTFIHTTEGKRYLVSKTLKALDLELQHLFVRVHKSFLVNLDYIVSKMNEGRTLKMACGKEVLVSRRKSKEVSNHLINVALA